MLAAISCKEWRTLIVVVEVTSFVERNEKTNDAQNSNFTLIKDHGGQADNEASRQAEANPANARLAAVANQANQPIRPQLLQ
jgi:hypothetical protein